jgi:prepilin-type N-terminal cleavage/methylation domain-containing protein
MKYLKNERGLTLIELLASMVILGIVLLGMINILTLFMNESKEIDTRIILQQEASKQLEEQRQAFYDRLEYVSFANLNDKPVLHTFSIDLTHEYYGEVAAELVEQQGRYQLIKLTSSLGDIDGSVPPVEVSQYVTNR